MDSSAKPTAAEWCELDPKVVIVQRHGIPVTAHVTYFGLGDISVLEKLPHPVGTIEADGNLFIPLVAPVIPWKVEVDVQYNKKDYALLSYGEIDNPLASAESLSLTIALPKS